MTNNLKRILPADIVEMLENHRITTEYKIFSEDGQWFYSQKEILNKECEINSETPIRNLGPFGSIPVDVKLILEAESSEYFITEIEGVKIDRSIKLRGIFTPLSPITLEGFARTTANIPEYATHFCWLYPVNMENTYDEKVQKENEISASLLKIGGFAYFRVAQNYELLSVNAIVSSETNGINFEGPFSWNSDYTSHLWSQNRFRPITLPCLLEKNARYFAFISPSERLRSSSKATEESISTNGAFVYLFNEDGSGHSYDCFFDVAGECLGFTVSDSYCLTGDSY